jgi:serralysin
VWSGKDESVIGDFFPYPNTFTGGVRVASLDMNGDGKWDILTGTGPGSGPGPLAEIFRGSDAVQMDSWTAYDPAFLGGIYVGALRMT